MASRKTTRSADPLEAIIRDLIVALGRKPVYGMEATPERAAEAWRVFTRGYQASAREVFSEGTFEAEHDGIVVVRGIDFYSVCEHHLVPFFGKCHIAYLPSGRIAGLSKFARLVDVHARRLQVQERMTHDIAHDIRTHLKPHGVAVQVEARHLCMAMRGVEQRNADVVTTTLLGAFKTDPARAAEFRALLSRRDD
ncbi:MAG TPA: GTP cyclohydrolase I FolE [Candidatus Krumholzibacteria bacterium]|nr:GTP cyclohydrolase I FolE [Candidatus Krumholzibacteria bacterium]